MDFGLSETQRLMQDGVMRFLQDHASIDALKNEKSWPKLQHGFDELGMMGALVAQDHGGMEASLLDAALVQEALGYFAAPISFMDSHALAPLAIKEAGSPAQQSEYLSAITSGTMRIGMAIGSLHGQRSSPSHPHNAIAAEKGKLSGTAFFASMPKNPTHILVASKENDFFLLPASSAGIDIQPLSTIDKTRYFSKIIFNQAAAEKLAGENRAGQTAERILAAGRILLAADMLGAGQSMLNRAVAYALERKQFGRQIGSFQAVKHMCAEMAAQLEPCRAMMWYAAYCFDERPDEAALMACLVKAHLGDVARFVARTSTEVHGGMGFVAETGLHFWFKRIGVNYQWLGAAERLREEAASLQTLDSA